MPDFPVVESGDCRIAFSTLGSGTMLGQFRILTTSTFATSGVYTTANTAVYMPVTIQAPFLAKKMGVDVGTQAGNLDVGIYSESGTRLVSSGSTAVATGGTMQVIDITDTWLMPGTYFVAMNCDSGTAAFVSLNLPVAITRHCGILEQAVGALALPTTATFATVSATRQVPLVLVTGSATL